MIKDFFLRGKNVLKVTVVMVTHIMKILKKKRIVFKWVKLYAM